jgi:hypothetical protein
VFALETLFTSVEPIFDGITDVFSFVNHSVDGKMHDTMNAAHSSANIEFRLIIPPPCPDLNKNIFKHSQDKVLFQMII